MRSRRYWTLGKQTCVARATPASLTEPLTMRRYERALPHPPQENRTMPFLPLHAVLAVAVPLLQDAVISPPARVPLPRPVASAPVATPNQNLVAAGRRVRDTVTLALDVVEAAFQAEGSGDPVVRILALAERGKTPQVPGPLLRAPVGTTVRLTLRNRSDSALMFSGFRPALKAADDTVQLPAGATRELTVRLDREGTFAYWGVLKGLTSFP